MNFLDIVLMSVGNLWRRKLRTLLTVLGVVIGATSVVVMLSLGIGLKASVMENEEQYGAMTEIEVSGSGYMEGNSNANSDLLLNDEALANFKNMEFVEKVHPKLFMSGTITQGKWTTWVAVIGIDQEELDEIEVGEGRVPTANSSKMELLIGNSIITNFSNEKTGENPYWDTGELPDVDLMDKKMFTKFDSTYETKPDGSQVEIPAKKNIFPVAGIVAGGVEDYNNYSYNIYTNIDSLKAYLKKTYKGKAIPGQPLGKNNKPLKTLVYESMTVTVDDAENVDTVLTSIQDLGYQAYSNKEWLDQMEQQFKIIEAVLGGIGAVSLLVAAIGITNTMTMSTYERTKEIGVIKVLGCSLGNIRMLFLSEAAMIGLLGGILGLLFSGVVSIILNMILGPLMELGDNVKVSQIPIWLGVSAIIFATLIGMVAGFFPAQRATKLSPLAAIRTE